MGFLYLFFHTHVVSVGSYKNVKLCLTIWPSVDLNQNTNNYK